MLPSSSGRNPPFQGDEHGFESRGQYKYGLAAYGCMTLPCHGRDCGFEFRPDRMLKQVLEIGLFIVLLGLWILLLIKSILDD
jgi:hypothetical protein